MTQETLTLALVQMTSTDTHAGNIQTVRGHVAEAAAKGADLVAFPEVAGLMNRRIAEQPELIHAAADDPYIAACQSLAAEHNLWIHTGSVPVTGLIDTRFRNHSTLINSAGEIVADYDKIHLFDITPESGKPIRESKRFAPGTYTALPNTPWGPWGMSICYDLRFPNLYQDYAKDGATLLFIPSAFTVPTGEAHWEPLLRARAIETGSFVIAAAQTGHHDDGRQTWGHSLVVDPWGKTLVDMGTDPGLALVTLDLTAVTRARDAIPNLQNARPYSKRP